MKRLHIDRLQLRLKNVDVDVAKAAALQLGPALEDRLMLSGINSAKEPTNEPIRIDGPLNDKQLRDAIVERVATEVRVRLARPSSHQKDTK